MKKKSIKIEELLGLFDEVQEGNPTRMQGDRTAGIDPLGYEKPEGVMAGQYDEIKVPDGQVTPRSSDQDLDELFPVK